MKYILRDNTALDRYLSRIEEYDFIGNGERVYHCATPIFAMKFNDGISAINYLHECIKISGIIKIVNYNLCGIIGIDIVSVTPLIGYDRKLKINKLRKYGNK